MRKILLKFCENFEINVMEKVNTFEKLCKIWKKTAHELCKTHFLEVIVKNFDKILSVKLLIEENFGNFKNCIKFYKKFLENWGKFSKILDKFCKILNQCSEKFFVKCRVDFRSEDYQDFELKVKENRLIISRKVWLIMKNFQKSAQIMEEYWENFK